MKIPEYITNALKGTPCSVKWSGAKRAFMLWNGERHIVNDCTPMTIEIFHYLKGWHDRNTSGYAAGIAAERVRVRREIQRLIDAEVSASHIADLLLTFLDTPTEPKEDTNDDKSGRTI